MHRTPPVPARRASRRPRLRAISAVALAGLFGLAGCASSSEEVLPILEVPDAEPDWSWASLGPNDVVRVITWGHPEASTKGEGERVDVQGNITLPMIGPVVVDGRTVDEARELITGELSEFIREPKVAVSVLHYGAREFYLMGQIESPGAYKLDRPLTALQALSYGGNVLRGAVRENIYLLRRSEQGFDVHVFDISRPGPDGLIAVRPNDLLFVARSGHGKFAEEYLPYVQGAGWLAAVPVAFAAFL